MIYMDGEDDKPKRGRPKKGEPASPWCKRIEYARARQQDQIARGNKYEKFIQGASFLSGGDIENGGNADSEANYEDTYRRTSINLMGSMARAIVPALMYQAPEVDVRAVDPDDEVATACAKVKIRLVNYIWRENDLVENVQMAVRQASSYGLGAVEHDFDDERKIPRTTWRDCRDVFIDPTGNGQPSSLAWVAIRFTMPVELARKIYDDKEIKPNIEPDQLPENRDHDSGDEDSHGNSSGPDARVTLYRIYVRGDSPDTEDADVNSEANATADGTTALEPEPDDGEEAKAGKGNRVLILDKSRMKILSSEPWGFTLDHDALPVTFLTLTSSPGDIWPHSMFRPVEDLQDAANFAFTYNVTRLRNGSAEKILVDSKLDESVIKQLRSANDLEIIRIKNMHKGLIDRVEMGQLSQAALDMLRLATNAFDDISGRGELSSANMAKVESATQAALIDEAKQIQLALGQRRVDKFLRDIARKDLQIALSLMTAKDVSRLFGKKVLGKITETKMMGENGKPSTTEQYEYWPEKRSPRDIRLESDVFVVPGTARRVSKSEEIQDILMLKDRIQGDLVTLQNTLPNVQFDPVAIINLVNAPTKKLARLAGLPELESALLKPEDITIVPPEPPPAPMPAGPEMGAPLDGAGLPPFANPMPMVPPTPPQFDPMIQMPMPMPPQPMGGEAQIDPALLAMLQGGM